MELIRSVHDCDGAQSARYFRKTEPTDPVLEANLGLRRQLINPNLSIRGNFLYFDRSHQWALGGEWGVACTGDPQVSLARSGALDAAIDAAAKAQQNRLRDRANQCGVCPAARVSVSFSFKPARGTMRPATNNYPTLTSPGSRMMS